MTEIERAEKICNEIVRQCPTVILNAVRGDKWKAAILCAEAYYRTSAMTAPSSKPESRDIFRDIKSDPIWKDTNLLWDLLLYLEFAVTYFNYVPVSKLIARYGLDPDLVRNIAVTLNYKIYNKMDEGDVLEEKETMDETHCNVSDIAADYARDIFIKCSQSRVSASALVRKVQERNIAPVCLFTQQADPVIMLMRIILSSNKICITADELSVAGLSPMLLPIFENKVLYRVDGTDKYYIDPDNFCIPTEIELASLKIKYSNGIRPGMSTIPYDLVEPVLNKEITREKLAEVKSAFKVAAAPSVYMCDIVPK